MSILARIRAALRSALDSLRGAFSWLEDGWHWLSSTPVGRATGYAWTAAKLPVALAGATVGLELLTRRDADRIGRVAGATWGAAKGAAPAAVRGARAVVAGTGAAVVGAALLPVRALGAVGRALSGGGAQTSEGEAAAKAKARAAQEQENADAAADVRAQIQAVRRIAAARVRGQVPDADAVELLRPQVVRYLLSLDVDECQSLARARTAALRLLLESGRAPEGIRGPAELAEDMRRAAGPAADSPEVRKARFKQAIREQRAARSSDIVAQWEARATAG